MFRFSWRPAYAGVLFLQLLLITDLTIVGLAKRGGGGAGRGAPSRGGINRGGGTRGGSQPTYNRQPSGGTRVGSIGNQKPSRTGGGLGTHLAAGAVGAVVGAAVSHQLTKSYYRSHYGGRDYYYGDRYYRPTPHMRKCTYPVTNDLQYDDGYKVRELVFECGRREHCCGDTCCSDGGMPWWGILLAILAVVCVVACCIYLVMKFRKSSSSTRYSNTAMTDASVPLQANTDDFNGGKAYAAYPGGNYATGPTYPAYPPGPGTGGWQAQPPPYSQPYGGYPPPAAPGYGFNVQPSGNYPRQY